MSILGFALAGAVEGAGKGIVADAQAKRAAMMEERREAREDMRAERDRDWRREEAETAYGRQVELSEKGYAHASSESAKDRAARAADAAANRAAADKRASRSESFALKRDKLSRRHAERMAEIKGIEDEKERAWRLELAERTNEWEMERLVKGDELVSARDATAHTRQLERDMGRFEHEEGMQGERLEAQAAEGAATRIAAAERQDKDITATAARQVIGFDYADKAREDEQAEARRREDLATVRRRKEAEDARSFAKSEAEKDRELKAAVAKGQATMVWSDGVAMLRWGDTVEPLKGADGKPVKIDRDTTNDAGARATVFKALMDSMKNDFSLEDADKRQVAMDMTDDFFGGASRKRNAGDDAAGTSPTSAASEVGLPQVSSMAQYQKMIADGVLKSGDYFVDPNGVTREVK